MRNIKLVLEYDGGAFYGFQRQDPKPTVQKTLEEAFEKLFHKKLKIKSASGRTDRGVHAQYQVVNFFTASKIPIQNILRGLNRYLPPALAVKEAEDVSKSFHARFNAKSKVYEYQVWNHPVRSPLHLSQTAHIPYRLNLPQMRKATRFLIGKHDFRSFAAVDPARKNENSVRTLKRLEIKKQGPLLRFTLEADGFLYYMVRNIVGTLLAVGTNRFLPADIQKILRSQDRKKAGATAPPQGLRLSRVKY